MKLHAIALGGLSALLAAACVPIDGPPPGPGPGPGFGGPPVIVQPGPPQGGGGWGSGRPGRPGRDRCGASEVAYMLGDRGDPRTIRQIERASGARQVRVLGPGDVTTMEYRAERLTVEVDRRNRITAIRCG